MKDTDICQW